MVSHRKLIAYFAVAAVATIALLCILFWMPAIERAIPSVKTRYIVIGVLFFTLVYVTNRIVSRCLKAYETKNR